MSLSSEVEQNKRCILIVTLGGRKELNTVTFLLFLCVTYVEPGCFQLVSPVILQFIMTSHQMSGHSVSKPSMHLQSSGCS